MAIPADRFVPASQALEQFPASRHRVVSTLSRIAAKSALAAPTDTSRISPQTQDALRSLGFTPLAVATARPHRQLGQALVEEWLSGDGGTWAQAVVPADDVQRVHPPFVTFQTTFNDVMTIRSDRRLSIPQADHVQNVGLTGDVELDWQHHRELVERHLLAHPDAKLLKFARAEERAQLFWWEREREFTDDDIALVFGLGILGAVGSALLVIAFVLALMAP